MHNGTSHKIIAIDVEDIIKTRWRRRSRRRREREGEDIGRFQVSLENDLIAHTSVMEIDSSGLQSGDMMVLSAYQPTWRDKQSDSIVYAAMMVKSADETSFDSLAVYKLRLKSRAARMQKVLLGKQPEPPLLVLEQSKLPIMLDRPHPYSQESPYHLTTSGQCILSSVNTRSKSRSMSVVSLEPLLEGDLSVVQLKPISFGRLRVAPGVTSIDKDGGCLAYVDNEEKYLTLQYYN